jgi:undecaprenyl-diphosphatase
MPSILTYVTLGIVQGITEFLPISSDGHLVVLSRWIETPGDELTLIVLLHLGSLGAIIFAFRREIRSLLAQAVRGRRKPADLSQPSLLSLIVLATLPVVIVGPVLHSLFVSAFESTMLAGAMLVLTGLILVATRALPEGNQAPNAKSALAMGFAQVFALLPGLSRSALTLTAGFALGGDRREVTRFSFLMAIPAIAGANLLEVSKVSRLQEMDMAGVAVGVITSFLASLAAIRILMRLVSRGRFEWFGAYCLVAGILVLSLG